MYVYIYIYLFSNKTINATPGPHFDITLAEFDQTTKNDFMQLRAK